MDAGRPESHPKKICIRKKNRSVKKKKPVKPGKYVKKKFFKQFSNENKSSVQRQEKLQVLDFQLRRILYKRVP